LIAINLLKTKSFDSLNNGSAVDDLGLSSDDSEDDDFNPAGPDSSEDQKGELCSEESDFTSDSDDFCAEIAKSFGQGETSLSSLSIVNEENRNRAFMEMEVDQDVVLPVSSRRQVKRLDYKKLYDVCYLFFCFPQYVNICMVYFIFLTYVSSFSFFLLESKGSVWRRI
jgi:hypothetical protein